MSKVGIHLLTWTSTLDENALKYFHKAKEMGYDGVEIFLPNPMKIKPKLIEKMRNELEKLGLECTGSAGLGANDNLVDENKSIREKGKAHLKKWINICSDLNCHDLAGVLYGTFEMSKGRGRTQEEWDLAVDSLKEIADYAKDKKVTLGMEVINRYETYFLNTAEDGVRLVKAIDRDNVKVHLDTYHMNIEEKDFYNPIIKTGKYLGHMHCCGNDRGIPGTGHINWDDVFKALSEIDYHQWLVIETFYGPIEGIPVAASVWRKLADNLDDIPREGLKFIREKAKQYGV